MNQFITINKIEKMWWWDVLRTQEIGNHAASPLSSLKRERLQAIHSKEACDLWFDVWERMVDKYVGRLEVVGGEGHYKENEEHVKTCLFTLLPPSFSILHSFYFLQPTSGFPAASTLYTCSSFYHWTKLGPLATHRKSNLLTSGFEEGNCIYCRHQTKSPGSLLTW